MKIAKNNKIANPITKNDRIKSRLTHVLKTRDTRVNFVVPDYEAGVG